MEIEIDQRNNAYNNVSKKKETMLIRLGLKNKL
jgi:hypothetical protein